MARARTTATNIPAKRAETPNNPPSGITRPRMRAYDGLWRQAFRYPNYTTDQLLQTKGWHAVSEMLTMAACRAPFAVKRYGVLSNGWEIIPAVTDPYDARNGPATEYADFIRYAVSNIRSPAGLTQDFNSVLFAMLRSNWEGFRVCEEGYRIFEDGPYSGLLGFDGFYDKHAYQIGFDIDPETEQILYVTSYTPGGSWLPGEPRASATTGGYDFQVPVDKCVIYTYNQEGMVPFGDGDWRGSYKHYFCLDNIYRIWAMALERWGAPVLVTQGGDDDLAFIQQVLDGIRDGAAAALPSNIKYELINAPSGVFDGFKQASQFHIQQIAQNIQANTLSTQEGTSGKGGLAMAEVHQDTGEVVNNHSRRDLELLVPGQVFDRLLRYDFADYDSTLCPQLSLGGDDTDDTFQLMQAFDLAIKDGVISKTAKFIRQSLGWPPLDPDEEKALEDEAKQQQEAQQQLADSRNSGKIGAMSDHQVKAALDILSFALNAQQYVKDHPEPAGIAS